jgi:hypothetical protein
MRYGSCDCKNSMARTVIFCFILVLLANAQPRGAPEISVDVQLREISPREHELHVTIQNQSSHAISMYRSQLPWVGRNSFTTIAVVPGMMTQTLRQVFVVDDHSPDVVELKSGESRSGVISLDARFPSLGSDLSKADIGLFWYFRFQPLLRGPVKYAGGWLLIPQRSDSPAK